MSTAIAFYCNHERGNIVGSTLNEMDRLAPNGTLTTSFTRISFTRAQVHGLGQLMDNGTLKIPAILFD